MFNDSYDQNNLFELLCVSLFSQDKVVKTKAEKIMKEINDSIRKKETYNKKNLFQKVKSVFKEDKKVTKENESIIEDVLVEQEPHYTKNDNDDSKSIYDILSIEYTDNIPVEENISNDSIDEDLLNAVSSTDEVVESIKTEEPIDEKVEKDELKVTSNNDNDYFKINDVGCILSVSDDVKEFTEVNIPSEINGIKVTAIGSNAFEGCTKLTAVVIPATIKNIYENAFNDCTNLRIVKYPDFRKQWKNITISVGNKSINSAGKIFNYQEN